MPIVAITAHSERDSWWRSSIINRLLGSIVAITVLQGVTIRGPVLVSLQHGYPATLVIPVIDINPILGQQ
jgi:hypothetical protein